MDPFSAECVFAVCDDDGLILHLTRVAQVEGNHLPLCGSIRAPPFHLLHRGPLVGPWKEAAKSLDSFSFSSSKKKERKKDFLFYAPGPPGLVVCRPVYAVHSPSVCLRGRTCVLKNNFFLSVSFFFYIDDLYVHL